MRRIAMALIALTLCGCAGRTSPLAQQLPASCRSFDGALLKSDDGLASCSVGDVIHDLVWVDDGCIHYTTVGWYRVGHRFHYDPKFNMNLPSSDGYPFSFCR